MDQIIELDTHKREYQYGKSRIAPLRRGEKNNVLLTVKICTNGVPYDLSGKTASLIATKAADKLVGPYAMECAEAGIARIMLPAALYSAVGVFTGYVEIREGDTLVDTTDSFGGKVIECADLDSEQAAEFIPLLGELQNAVAEEAKRVEAEKARVQAETERATGFAEAKQASQAATEAANDAAADANLAAGTANDAAKSANTAAGKATNAAAKAESYVRAFVNAAGTAIGDAIAAAREDVDAAVKRSDAATAKAEDATETANAANTAATQAVSDARKAIAEVKATEAKLYPAAENILVGSESGALAHADDAFSAKALGLSVYGKSEQVTTTGANKFNPAEIQDGSANGLTWKKNEDGSITVKGTSTALVNINLVANPSEFILSTGKWTGSVKGASKAKLIVQTLDGVQICNTNTSTTRENKTEQGLKYFLLQVQAQTTLNETIFVYLEKSDKALYEEYTDGKPSPSPKYPREITNVANADIAIAGKNLVEKAVVDSYTARFATVLKLKMKLFPSTQYCLSFEDAKDNQYYLNETVFDYQQIVATGSRQFLLLRTKDVLDKSNRLQFDPINGCWIVLKNDKEQSNVPQFKNVQVELGGENTPYEAPSKPITLPINLAGNELCRLPNGVRDEVRIDSAGNVELVKRVMKRVMDGSADEDWRRNGETDTHVRFYIVFDDKAFGTPRTEHVVSDRFSSKNTELAKRETLRLVEIGMPKSIVPTLDISLLRAWLAKNPTTFIYKLATPIITSLGKVDMPTLPAPVCNAWVESDVPTECGFRYVRDVNIVIANLEAAIASITEG